jgi:glycosyltransferase involved in cell wall biosynthesis
MKVIYSPGCIVGGHGVGTTSYYTALETYKRGMLDKILCWDYKLREIKPEKIISFKLVHLLERYPLRFIQKYFFKKFDNAIYQSSIYDFLASKKIGNCDIFLGGTGNCKRSLIKAKKNGAIGIIHHWSSHPLTQYKLMKEEYKILGKNYFFNSEKFRKRMIDECAIADYVLIPSEFVYQSFMDNGFPKEKLILIPFGVDLKRFSTQKNKKDKNFRAIFVGQVTIRKGIHYLLKAWKELNLKNAELLIVGNICDDAKETINQYKDNKSIRIEGFKHDTQEYYKQSDIFVTPSIEEGSALVTFEAMASGLPVIVTPNTGSIARDKKDGFIVPIRDVNAIKSKILYFYNHPKEIKSMGKNARKYVEGYTWERYGKEIVKVCEKVLKKKNEQYR